MTAAPVPVPVSVTDCVLPATSLLLSVIVSVAVRLPEAGGVKVTLIVHPALAASELAQVVVSAKSPGLDPERPMLVTDKVAFPVLFSVKLWTALMVPRL